MRDIYKKTKLVDSSRMNEKAVLHPVGAYCLNDNSGYVALILNKDTSESMRNLLRKVIMEKRKEMPGLEKVVILADGGGSNMSHGIVWKDELLELADETVLPLRIAHFPPNASKRNPIERMLWSPISIHWKGIPLLNIECVMQLIGETTTHPKSGSPLKINCWFDSKRYLTNAEKKAVGIPVPTRADLDKKSANRIIYEFSKGNDMDNWNYTVLPTTMAVQNQVA